jgi:hypothetical protein
MKALTTIISVLLFLNMTSAQETDPLKPERGNLLPEVLITGEIQLKILLGDENSNRAEEFNSLQFKLYASKTEALIEKNDNDIAQIKQALKNKRGRQAIKYWKEITRLEIENEQLKTDFWNYLHYGLGDCLIFQNEFTQDLQPLAQDLTQLHLELR